MELFARCDREPERLLAVTEEGKRYTLGDLNAAAERIAGAVAGMKADGERHQGGRKNNE